jgi:hypothetical protein
MTVFVSGAGLSCLTVYNLRMLGYWMPYVRCKTAGCYAGKHMPLPYPSPPKITLNQPSWPTDAWQPVLICRHCELGYVYTAQNVGWESFHKPTRAPHDNFLAYELKCAQKDCSLPVKLYAGIPATISTRDMDTRLESESRKAKSPQVMVRFYPLMSS